MTVYYVLKLFYDRYIADVEETTSVFSYSGSMRKAIKYKTLKEAEDFLKVLQAWTYDDIKIVKVTLEEQ